MSPEELKYSKDHVWVAVEGAVARMGITDHAQKELGDVVFLDLPEVGRTFTAGDVMGSIESIKTTNDLFIPLSGAIAEINAVVRDKPDTVNADPLGQGWLVRVQLSAAAELGQLMDLEAYTKFVQG